MKKLLVLFISIFAFISIYSASECKNKINVYMFYGDGCPHCEAATEYFDELSETLDDCFDLKKYEVWSNDSNALLMKSVSSYFDDDASGVPYIIIGDKTFMGYAEDYNDSIKSAITNASNSSSYVDIVANVENGTITESDILEKEEENESDEDIEVDGNVIYEDEGGTAKTIDANNSFNLRDYVEQNLLLVIVGLLSIISFIISIIDLISLKKIKVMLKKNKH